MPYVLGFVLALVVVAVVFLMLAMLAALIQGWAALLIGIVFGVLIHRRLTRPRTVSSQ